MDGKYALGEKLRKEHAGRGEAVNGIRASSTEELVNRAAMGRDPNVNCSEEAFNEKFSRRSNQTNQANAKNSVPVTNAGGANTNNARRPVQRKAPSINAGGAEKTQNSSRNASRNNSAKTAVRNRNGRTAVMTAGQRGYSSAGQNIRYNAFREEQEVIDIKKKRIQPSTFFMALIVLTAIILVVTAFAERSTHDKNIDILEKQLEAKQEELVSLQNQLNDKNDIREIEEIAVNELGMVKEDSLQRKYVTIYQENLVEIYDDEEDTSSQLLLDNLFAGMRKFFERYK